MRYSEFKENVASNILAAMMSKAGADVSSFNSTDNDPTDSSANAGNTGSGSFKSSPGQINPNEITSYLKGKGFDKNQIAGWLVNIKWESSFRPGAYVASDAGQGQSGGFFGFHDPVNGKGLFTDMVKFTGGGNKWQSNWQGQLDFALQDNRGQQYRNLSFNSPGEAAHWWVVNYEKPANTRSQAIARAKDASRYA